MTPTLLSPEALDAILKNIEDEYPSIEGKLRAHIAALEADNAALLKALNAVAWRDIVTAKDEGEHDMAVRVSQTPHPGAALLSEHAKALVRARNEGLEMAAARCDALRSEARAHDDMKGALHFGQLARDLRAMKETEG